ncbi:hypothetical protein ACFO9E_13075 [Streptomyces maoxianensis]|uniref:Uncharacterized protein n=1 Tax=Streptomyces maoxianensis TaxID=1459942 RepID=A0ABV9G3H4_9ACTN
MITTRYRTLARMQRISVVIALLGVSACTASSDGPSATVGAVEGYRLTIENADTRCAYATVKVRTEGSAAGGQPGVVYSEAFSGGKVPLSDKHYDDEGEATPLPKGEYESRAYLSRPVGDYTAVLRDAGGKDIVTTEFRVTKTAEGKQRTAYPYVVEPSLFTSGEATPGSKVRVTAHDEGPDQEEETVSISSDAFDKPVKLTFRGKAYEGEATIRRNAEPGRYKVTVTNHFGCGAISSHIAVGT